MKVAILAGLVLALTFIMAGMVGATTYECDSCSSCNATINSASSGDTIQLNASITGSGSSGNTCITIYPAGVTLDCRGYYINGIPETGSVWGVGTYGENVTITNCNIQGWKNVGGFSSGVIVRSNGTSVLNSNMSYNGQGFQTAPITSNTLTNIYMNNCTIFHNTDNGLYSTTNSLIENSVFDANIGDSPSWGAGLVVRGSNNTIRNCVFKDSYSGSYPNGWSDGTTLTGIHIDDNSALGRADYNTITNCSFIHNSNAITSAPYYSNSVQYNIINDSIFTGNGEAIVLKVQNGGIPEFTMIYNNFLNNTANINIDDYAQYWNTTITNATNIIGKPQIGGNYWATSAGTGYSETCADINLDGFCDSPYTLTSSNIDYLPLTNANSTNITFISQSPTDLSSTNAFGKSINITYDIIGTLGVTDVALHHKTFANDKAYLNGIRSPSVWNSGYYWLRITNQNIAEGSNFTMEITGNDIYMNVTINGIQVFTNIYITDTGSHSQKFINSSMSFIASPLQINVTYVGNASGNNSILRSSNAGNYSSCGQVNAAGNCLRAYMTFLTPFNDCWVYINGVQTPCGYQTQALTTNISDTWLFRLFDNQVYPATYNINETYMEQTQHSIYNIADHSSYVKIRLYNVSSTKQYSQFEVMANDSSSNTTLGIFYCNESYTTGDPDTSPFCTNFYSLLGNVPYNHTHTQYSSHMLIPFSMNTTTGTIGGVQVTPTSYFLLRGNSSTWHAYYISNDTGSAETTTDNGTTWTPLAGTIDSHLHQYYGTDTLAYYASACNGLGKCVNSSTRLDLINLGGLSPTAPDIYSPTGAKKGIISINYTQSISPNGYAIVSYNISLLNTDNSLNMTIADNNSPNFGYIWDSTPASDGEYKIGVEACDSNSLCTLGIGNLFTIDNTIPIVTIYSPQAILYNASASVPLQVSANEPIALWTYSLNSSNISFTPNTTITGAQGLNSLTIYARDNAGNIGIASTSFTIGVAPNVTIISPINTTYSTLSISLAVTADKPVSAWWYVLNGGNATIFVPNITIAGIEGSNTLIVYANDTFANQVSKSVTFTIDTTPPTPRPIDNLGAFGGVVGIVIGAGLLLFILGMLFENPKALLQDPKKLMMIFIAGIIGVVLLTALF
jgi:hypothetical protein